MFNSFEKGEYVSSKNCSLQFSQHDSKEMMRFSTNALSRHSDSVELKDRMEAETLGNNLFMAGEHMSRSNSRIIQVLIKFSVFPEPFYGVHQTFFQCIGRFPM